MSNRKMMPIVPSDKVPAHARVLLLSASTMRIAYGVGALLEPQRMVSKRFAPDTHDFSDPRLLLRAFGGHQLVTGALTLAASRSLRLARAAAALSLLIDLLDVLCALIEIRARGQRDGTTSGGIVVSGAGVTTFATTLCVLRP
jgi:hypothetical protein